MPYPIGKGVDVLSNGFDLTGKKGIMNSEDEDSKKKIPVGPMSPGFNYNSVFSGDTISYGKANGSLGDGGVQV